MNPIGPASPPRSAPVSPAVVTPTPPPKYTALTGNLKTLLPRAVKIWSTTVLAHGVLAPIVVAGYNWRVPNFPFNSQFLQIAAAMMITSALAAVFPLPMGHILQWPDLMSGKNVSREVLKTMAIDFALAMTSQILVGRITNQTWTAILVTGGMRALTRGLPLSYVYKWWGGDQDSATKGRQAANIGMMVNNTFIGQVATQLTKAHHGFWPVNAMAAAEVAMVSLLTYWILTRPIAERWIGPKAKVGNNP